MNAQVPQPEPPRRLPKHFLALLTSLAVASAAAGGMIGYVAAPKSPLPPAGAITQSPSDAEDVRARNVVWRVFNGEAEAIGDDEPAKFVGNSLKAILAKDSDGPTRVNGVQMLFNKSGAYFTEAQRGAIADAILGTDAQTRAVTMFLLANADMEGARLARGVMADQPRLLAFMAGQKVQLETLPDGSIP